MSFIYFPGETNEQSQLQFGVDIKATFYMPADRGVSALPRARPPAMGLWKTVADSEGEFCSRRGGSRPCRAPAARKPSRSPGLLESRVALAAGPSRGASSPTPPPPAASAAVSSATSDPALPPPPPALGPGRTPRWPRGRSPHLRVRRHPAGAHSGTASGALPEFFRVTAEPTRQGCAWRPRAGGRPLLGRAGTPGRRLFSAWRPGRRPAASASLGIRESAPTPHREFPEGSVFFVGATKCGSPGSGS